MGIAAVYIKIQLLVMLHKKTNHFLCNCYKKLFTDASSMWPLGEIYTIYCVPQIRHTDYMMHYFIGSPLIFLILFCSFSLGSITVVPHPEHLILKSAPIRATSHSKLPHGCFFLRISISPILMFMVSPYTL